ncbi:MAG: DciA family protein [Candidatus Andersenbacteria bacterium]
MRSLREDIQFLARRYGLRQGVEAAAVLKAARQVLPQVLPRLVQEEARVEAYRDGTLFITAPSGPAVATVFGYRQPLLQALKIKLGRAMVAKVVVRPRLAA